MNPQMRMVIMLGVTWAAGSLLLAAESPSARAPANASQAPPAAPAPAAGEAAEALEPDAEPKPQAQEKPPQAAQPAGESKPAAAEAADDAESLPPPPPVSGARGASPQRFVPSEQVRADFDVSFPIDI